MCRRRGTRACAVIGFIAGVINAFAAGGSFLTLPLLLFLGLPAAIANGTNRVGVLSQNIGAVWGFHRHEVLDWKWSLACERSRAGGRGHRRVGRAHHPGHRLPPHPVGGPVADDARHDSPPIAGWAASTHATQSLALEHGAPASSSSASTAAFCRQASGS